MNSFFMRTFFTVIAFVFLSLLEMPSCLAGTSSADGVDGVMLDTTFVNVADTVNLQVSDCTNFASLCIDLPIDDVSLYNFTANDNPYNLGFSPCDFDTIIRYSYNNLGATGPYRLDNWTINSIQQAAGNVFNDIDELVTIMNTIDPLGNWTHDSGTGLISGGLESNEYSQMQVFEFATLTTQTLFFSTFIFANGTDLNFPIGFTEFILTQQTSGLKDTFNVQVTCVQTDTVNLNLLISDSSVECLDFGDLLGDVDTVFNICPASSGNSANALLVNGDSCLVITTFALGTDQFCMVACDDLGICDTTTYIVNVNVPGTPGTVAFNDTLVLGIGDIFCPNTGVLPGTPDTIYNICPGLSGESVGIFINQNTFCVSYNGFAVGTDTACIVVCDDMNVCDTTLMSITIQTLGADNFYDTIAVNTSETFCSFDLSELQGTLVGITNGCAGNTGGFVDFTIDAINNCVTYTGLAAGKDTACIYLTDNFGNMDTLNMIVCAQAPTTETIVDTIRLGLTVNYCLDLSELGGAIMDSIFICGSDLNNVITFDANSLSLCVDVTGENLGTGSFCVAVCDDMNVCDTTIFQITVSDDDVFAPPVGVADTDTTQVNQPIVTNVCANDELPGNMLTSFYVLPIDQGGNGPFNGEAFVNNDCTINYSPLVDFCGFPDTYSYVSCNNAGCDTTLVTIFVACPVTELTFYNGFSPNGDNVNDFFEIGGVEGLPDNTLTLYNRWGNKLFEKEAYTNAPGTVWDGTWEGVDLPDGIYFYLFDHGDGEKTTGWVTLSR